MNTIKQYAETVPTGLSARMALAEMDLAATCSATEVRMIDGVPVTITGGAMAGPDRIGDDELRRFISETVEVLEPEERDELRLVA